MRWCRSALLLAILFSVATPAQASIFGKRTRPDPAKRVPELVGIVRTDPDERKRSAAAEELRQFDPKAFPFIVPVLIDVLHNDKATGVRLEAVQTLGKLRPVSQEAGLALERAASADSSLRVRLQAKTSLLFYRLSGYHTPRPEEMEGPVLRMRPEDGKPIPADPKSQLPWWATRKAATTTTEPPLANPPAPGPAPRIVPPLVPVDAPRLQTPPPMQEEGPRLTPPG
jgi:hypothetical protein